MLVYFQDKIYKTRRAARLPNPGKVYRRGGTWNALEDWAVYNGLKVMVYTDTTYGNVGYFLYGTKYYSFNFNKAL